MEPYNDSLEAYEDLEAETNLLRAQIKELRAAIENVLVASEDNGDMNDIDWDQLRATLANTAP